MDGLIGHHIAITVTTMVVTPVREEAILMAVFIIVLQTAGLINIMEYQEELRLMPHIIIPEQRVFPPTIPAEQADATVPIVRSIPGGLQILIPLQEMKMFRAEGAKVVHQVHPERILLATVNQEHIAALHIMNRVQVLPALPGLKALR